MSIFSLLCDDVQARADESAATVLGAEEYIAADQRRKHPGSTSPAERVLSILNPASYSAMSQRWNSGMQTPSSTLPAASRVTTTHAVVAQSGGVAAKAATATTSAGAAASTPRVGRPLPTPATRYSSVPAPPPVHSSALAVPPLPLISARQQPRPVLPKQSTAVNEREEGFVFEPEQSKRRASSPRAQRASPTSPLDSPELRSPLHEKQQQKQAAASADGVRYEYEGDAQSKKSQWQSRITLSRRVTDRTAAPWRPGRPRQGYG